MRSLFDLLNSERPQFDELVGTVTARKGHCSPFEQGLLVEYFKEYGYDVMKDVLGHCMVMNWLRPAQWKLVANLHKRYGSDTLAWGVERVLAKENYSIDTLDGILRKEIPAYRKAQANTVHPAPAGVQKRSKYPTPEGVHSLGTAQSWLIQHGKERDQLLEFFDLAGRDPEGQFALVQLKSEYR